MFKVLYKIIPLHFSEFNLIHNSSRLSDNNFDFLRLLFASIVCLVHIYALTGYEELAIVAIFLSSEMAVKAFFVVSGFLIVMSYERSSSIYSYAKKRVRRIYPAYITVILICAFGLLSMSSLDIAQYFSLEWLKYLIANLFFLNFLQHSLPGVFEANKLQAVNGALWTLKVEVLFYMSVPIIVFLCKRFGYLLVIFVIYLMSVLYLILCTFMAEKTGSGIYLILDHQFPAQLSYFMAGVFFYYYLPLFERRFYLFLSFAIVVLVINFYWPIVFLEPFALATVVLFFALFLYMGNFGKYGDFSYGVYILHFPIIQGFIHFGWLSDAPWIFLICAALATVVSAFIMWHFVEKRFLSKRNHYVAVTNK